jgi:hypothetical protein
LIGACLQLYGGKRKGLRMLRHLGRIYTRLGGATHVAWDVQSITSSALSITFGRFDHVSSINIVLFYFIL